MYTPKYSEDAPAPDEIASSTGPLILEFGTNWCPICTGAQPDIKQALENAPDVSHVKVEDGPGRKLGRPRQTLAYAYLPSRRAGGGACRATR